MAEGGFVEVRGATGGCRRVAGTGRAKRRLLRLDEVGLPATAVVLSVEPISEDPAVRVRLLIKGPDVPEFVIEHDARYEVYGVRRPST